MNAKKKEKKSSMFQEDLFTVVVLQRPVASSPFVTLWVQGGRAANLYLRYIELDSFFHVLFFVLFFWKTIKISFVNLIVWCVFFFIHQKCWLFSSYLENGRTRNWTRSSRFSGPGVTLTILLVQQSGPSGLPIRLGGSLTKLRHVLARLSCKLLPLARTN